MGLVSPYDLSIPGGVQAQVLGLAAYLRSWGDNAVVIGPGLPDGVPGVDLGESLSVPEWLQGPDRCRPSIPEADQIGSARSRPASCPRAAHAVGLLARHPCRTAGRRHFSRRPRESRSSCIPADPPAPERLLGNTTMVTAVSRAAASVLPDGLEVRIIPNGLDVESMKVETAREPKKVAYLGRDEPRKASTSSSTRETVKAARPEAELVVMGSQRDDAGPTWMGRVDEGTKAMVMSSSSIYVAPQTGGESFGVVLLEAMAAGAAVVASDLDSFRDWAGDAALLFPVGSSEALATAVIELLENPGRRQTLAEDGRTLAEAHDWGIVGGTYRELYDEVVA